MSNNKFLKEQEKRHAAHLLMSEFVKNHASEVAEALENIIVLRDEIDFNSLQHNMSVVNQTFAYIALMLIDHNSGLDPNDIDNMVLPVSAKKMNETIEELSRFIHSVERLFWVFFEKYRDDAAVELANKTFWTYDAHN